MAAPEAPADQTTLTIQRPTIGQLTIERPTVEHLAVDQPLVAPPPARRRARVGIVLALLAAVAALVGYLVQPTGANSADRAPGRATSTRPGPDRGLPVQPARGHTEAAVPVDAATEPPSAPDPTTAVLVQPVATPPPQADRPSHQVDRLPTTSAAGTPPPFGTGRHRVELPGEPAIHCPTPYLGTPYGPVAQCTQHSGDQARPGFYSPVTGDFEPTTDWVTAVDDEWHDGSVLATDGVEAPARGYASVETPYGPGVWATQYRDGQARWGVINLIDGRFRPAEQGAAERLLTCAVDGLPAGAHQQASAPHDTDQGEHQPGRRRRDRAG